MDVGPGHSLTLMMQGAAGLRPEEKQAAVEAPSLSLYRPGTVTVKLKELGAASGLLATQLGIAPTLGQLAAASVPEGRNPDEYSSELEAVDGERLAATTMPVQPLSCKLLTHSRSYGAPISS